LHRVLLMVKARRVAIASQKSRSAFSPALFGADLAIRIAINNQNNHPKKDMQDITTIEKTVEKFIEINGLLDKQKKVAIALSGLCLSTSITD